ncbi:hypothetical protein [Microbacterium plantarum]|uniref:hypothetical protein n=1 Tax=Microbacterium plantarum TaxID=1816425 RepID=UPI002B4716DF|nr:hypothetical protein [Microbacterium plantarum]WRK16494.1 hypothetical protein VC184_11305 [Microbacterium plantarum]
MAGSGSVSIVWSDDHASSMLPRQIGDWFSPFGSELQVDVIVRAGRFSERIPQGRFVIESVPEANRTDSAFGVRKITAGEVFKVELRDPLVRVARDEFSFPTAPSSTSAWGEIQATTGFPVVRNMPDVVVPGSVSYADEKSGVLNKLFDLLGAWPHVDAAGALTARPKAWPAPMGVVTGVVSAPISMRSEKTYNRVVVEGKSPEGLPLYGVADVREGFLRVANADGSASPFGVAVYRYASDFLQFQGQVNAEARALLERVSRVRSVTRRVEEPFNPTRELGDVLTLHDGVGRVIDLTHDGAVTQMVLEVPDE